MIALMVPNVCSAQESHLSQMRGILWKAGNLAHDARRLAREGNFERALAVCDEAQSWIESVEGTSTASVLQLRADVYLRMGMPKEALSEIGGWAGRPSPLRVQASVAIGGARANDGYCAILAWLSLMRDYHIRYAEVGVELADLPSTGVSRDVLTDGVRRNIETVALVLRCADPDYEPEDVLFDLAGAETLLPNNPVVALLRGRALLALKRPEDAKPWLERAAETGRGVTQWKAKELLHGL